MEMAKMILPHSMIMGVMIQGFMYGYPRVVHFKVLILMVGGIQELETTEQA